MRFCTGFRMYFKTSLRLETPPYLLNIKHLPSPNLLTRKLQLLFINGAWQPKLTLINSVLIIMKSILLFFTWKSKRDVSDCRAFLHCSFISSKSYKLFCFLKNMVTKSSRKNLNHFDTLWHEEVTHICALNPHVGIKSLLKVHYGTFYGPV